MEDLPNSPAVWIDKRDLTAEIGLAAEKNIKIVPFVDEAAALTTIQKCGKSLTAVVTNMSRLGKHNVEAPLAGYNCVVGPHNKQARFY